MTIFQKVEKVTKNDLTIISKPHAHSHIMKKTYVKFHNDRYKAVRGVALPDMQCTMLVKKQTRSTRILTRSLQKSTTLLTILEERMLMLLVTNW